ncbi:hypothetical protein K438DRAFT_1971507 [Mycena galopus ATCC 62051]|nr:hypothetical protein K438DRAFT_1971507 [Mycena galopus ATCC 62051]
MSTSTNNPTDDSPHKVSRAESDPDATTRLPPIRTERERPSPGPNRKASGSGAAGHRKTQGSAPGPDGTTPDVFVAAAGASALPEEYVLGGVRGSRSRSRRRDEIARSQAASPTPSQRAPDGLVTGHHTTDIESTADADEGQPQVGLEDGEIPENEDAAMVPTPIDDDDGEAMAVDEIDHAATADGAAAPEAIANEGAAAQQDLNPPPAPQAAQAADNAAPAPPYEQAAQGMFIFGHNAAAAAQLGQAIAYGQNAAATVAAAQQGPPILFGPNIAAAAAPVQPGPAAAQDADAAHLGPIAAQPHPVGAQLGPGAAYLVADAQRRHANRQRGRGPFFGGGRAEAMVAAAVGAANIRAADVAGAAGVDARVAGAAAAAAAAGAVAFAFPDLATHAAAPPKLRDENLHHLFAPASPLPEPTGPADLGAATLIQPNTGKFRYLIISREHMHHNLAPHWVALYAKPENLGTHLYAVLINGGHTMNSKLGDPTIHEAITKAIVNHANPATTMVFPVSGEVANPRGTYAGPIFMGIKVDNAEDRTRLIDQLIFAIDRTYAFYIVAPEHLCVPWTFTIVRVSIGGGTRGAEIALRGAVSEFIWTDNAFRRGLSQATSAHDQSPLDERCFKLSETVDCTWNELGKYYAVYVKPCTTNATLWQSLTAIVQRQTLRYGHYSFESVIDPDAPLPGPRCVSCKNGDHEEGGCATIKDADWWGATTQIKNMTEGPLAHSTTAGRGRGRGMPRGGTRGSRGSTRGVGRGQSRARGG